MVKVRVERMLKDAEGKIKTALEDTRCVISFGKYDWVVACRKALEAIEVAKMALKKL